MTDLSTRYLGLRLKSPLVHSASPLTRQLDNIRRLEDEGASAVVLYSLFEEEIDRDALAMQEYMTFSGHSYAEAQSYFPDLDLYSAGPDAYLELVHKAKEAVQIPIIGSLNGVTSGGWVEYARRIEQAGADALELNVYFVVTDPTRPGCEVEQMYLDLVRDVQAQLHIPLAVKLGPFFTNFANMAMRLDELGVAGLVLFNRFYQPDLDIENLSVKTDLDLSKPYELRLRLRWVAILYAKVRADLAVTGGVHSHTEVLKAMMAGAKVAMMTSALLKHGPGHLRTVEEGLRRWMEEHEYESIEKMQGSLSQRSVLEPAAFERANYMKVLRDFRVASF
jgi:dihydroorotate dehydrogenase (fumarate)